ncbi:probable glutamyl endopeptidase, chloroplastic [Physcomitrium patens]|uniref:Probable glutamyl endopeptidase, chloroplastic n=1 Tax=Physcomitrium patens TaxID=3218 RepID=A0A2K1KG29_PHYPA|nr:probable glutamyl endopeptidase, chloroplastic [Physcomitrium patens]PNR52732.1 hypothetical protein PHYPA_009107 [Physcomitrium patens]|eukprot:XP_024379189.1 probable glutamyl endopeptidase, chloroplastic [Physcomitrella patens]
MYAASSKLSSSGCLLSTFSSYRKWVHHFAVTLPLQQRKSFQSSCVTRVPRRFVGLPCSISPLRVVPAQLTSTRLLVVALNDKRGNGSTNTDGAVTGYQLPPKEIREIVDAPPIPALSFSPKRDEIVFLQRRSLPPVAEFAKPELKLAGIRIDPDYNSGSRMSFYTGISIRKLLDEGILGPERSVDGLPEDARINFVSWSPDGQHLAFSVRGVEEENGPPSLLTLWIANVKTGKARRLIGPPELHLNSIFESYSWVDDETIVVSTIPATRGAPPKKPLTPSGPKIQSNEEQLVVQNRTYQDLLKDKHDEDLFDYYTTAQLVLVTLDGKAQPIGQPATYVSVEASPDSNFLLVEYLHRPYSFIVPCGRFPKTVEVWRRDGEFVKQICDLPLAEDVPIASNSTRKGRRGINWRSDKPASLYWVETQDGGDPKVDVSPRDIVYSELAEIVANTEPQIIAKTDLRYGGIVWGDESLALVYESWYKTRRTRTWIIAPGTTNSEPRILFDRSSEDVYSDPGSPMLRRTALGTYVLAQLKNSDEKRCLLLNGSGASPEGYVPFLDVFDTETGKKERIWESDKEKYFEDVAALMSDQVDADLSVDTLKLLISKESQLDPPQYYLRTWPEQKETQVTNFPHPYPQLRNLKKEIIRYARNDGVQLMATLYLPPGYDPSRDGPLPMLMWAYPREFKSKDNAGQMRGSPNTFAGIGSTSALLWLARGFAILDGPTMPIIGEGEEEANDRYVEQLVASAQAAVDEVVRRGVADPKKIAVGGHSYGAFMTANLLIHAPNLFCCGISRSGAYNRTLTPFGFQSEERTLWEAQKTYIEMSPFMLADKVKKPILLIHGEEDNNAGTLTMQSERFYAALKGNGALCRLVLLPLESHGYSGRESVMHCLWEMDRWLQKYCVQASNKASLGQSLNGDLISAEKNS